MYKQLTLRNFTAFAEAELNFVPGINVYTGVNGCGKTHILKLMYALQKHQTLSEDPSKREALDVTLMSVFKPDSLGRLVRRQQGVQACGVTARFNNKPLEFQLNTRSKLVDVETVWTSLTRPIFIPAKDILGHSVRFLEAYELGGWLDFDVTYRDLLVHSAPDLQRGPIPPEQKRLLSSLGRAMTGTVTRNRMGRFYLKNRSGNIEFPLLAEGWRKLGLLWTLIRNGSLTAGSVLYWDEPEANLNPGMFPMVAEILAKLASTGIQIHVASHAYAMLRELEIAADETSTGLRMFALDRRNDGVAVSVAARFIDLVPNPILDEYERILPTL